MTTTTAEPRRTVLKTIVVSNGTCLLNGNKDWPVPLSHEWKPSDLYQLIPAYAPEYDVDFVNETHVKTIVDNYSLEIHNGKANKKKGKDREGDEAKSNAELLMELANQKIEMLFKDQNGFAHAVISIGDHKEVLSVETGRFKRYLIKLFWDEYQKVVSSESVKGVSQILQAKSEHEGETFPLNLRVSSYMNSIYYDLTDEEWRSVKISKNEWQIETETPILFTRHRATPQAEPDRNYGNITLDDFVKLTNLKDPMHQLLVKVYIVSLFVPDISHAILNLYGEKGSAKSMLFTLIKLLVDPSKPVLLTLHKDPNEFIQQLAHNWVAYYDNAKHVPDWLSNEACRAVTGGGHTKRALYSNDDDFVYDYKRNLGFNGINITLTSEDALDRSIMLVLERISRHERQLEAAIMSTFEELRPKLLGYIFDILVKAMNIKETLVLEDLPRMADFAIWGEAIARAIGYENLDFINAFYDNIGQQNVEAIDAHPLGQAITKWVQSWPINAETEEPMICWQGPPQRLLDELEPIAVQTKIDTTHGNWPKAPNYLSNRLNKIRSNLLEGLGIETRITRITRGVNKGRAVVKVRKVSPLSSPSSPDTGGIQHTLDIGGDSGDSEDKFHTEGES